MRTALSLTHQLACSAALSPPHDPDRGRASTTPVTLFCQNVMLLTPASSRAAFACPSGRATFVPAVTEQPAATTQSSPSGMPRPEIGPGRQRSPSLTTVVPPPERVPWIE